jgi:hypothetical protein
MNFGSKLVEGVPSAVRADPMVQAAYLGGEVQVAPVADTAPALAAESGAMR